MFLFNAIQNIDVVREKAQWAMNWMNKEKSFHERIVAFAAV
jgi:ribonucleoside-diphosphate reductase subunit M2